MEEVWRDIPKYEGYYQASSTGRIRSVDRIISHFRKPEGRVVRGIILTPSKYKSGYLYVHLSVKGRSRKEKVYRLVAVTFLGLNTNSRDVVDHINNDKSNNSIQNLSVVTSRYNISKGYRDKNKRRGVHKCKITGKWKCQIKNNGKQEHLGSYESKEDAYETYRIRYKQIHGLEPWKH